MTDCHHGLPQVCCLELVGRIGVEEVGGVVAIHDDGGIDDGVLNGFAIQNRHGVLNALHDYPISLTILSVAGIKQLSKLLKGSFETVYVMCDYVTLVERMLRLGHTNADIKYHLEYAENNNEFDSWKVTTYVLKNVSDPQQAVNQLLTVLGLTQIVPPEEFKKRIGR